MLLGDIVEELDLCNTHVRPSGHSKTLEESEGEGIIKDGVYYGAVEHVPSQLLQSVHLPPQGFQGVQVLLGIILPDFVPVLQSLIALQDAEQLPCNLLEHFACV